MAAETADRTFELVDKLGRGRSVAERDDQFELQAFLDGAAAAGRRGARLSVIDTGRFGLSELELLVERGTNLLTSDETGRAPDDLEVLLEAGARSGAFIARLMARGVPAEESDASGWTMQRLLDLAGAGLDIHLSDQAASRGREALKRLACPPGRRRGFFVYYHHGALENGLAELAGRRNWLHFSDRSVISAEDGETAAALAAAFKASGGRAVVYVERGLEIGLLKRLDKAGALLNFLTPPSSRYSLQKAFEDRARKARLPVRAYYLTTSYLL